MFAFIYFSNTTSSNYDPITTWVPHETPEDAGWSSEKLQDAWEYYNSINSTAAMAIKDGKVLFAWGDISANTNGHSIRKSFLSALYGIYEDTGEIDLQSSLHELNIDDQRSLSDAEKAATIHDLLISSSGVYHTAGQETLSMRRKRPFRESNEPGSYFYYNNWDFNALGTILNEQTNSDLFVEFKEKIADPIGMEDFSLENTEYRRELGRSIHPSYLFRISARDMARFGQLYLQNGMWGDEQIIPKDWVKQSTQAYAHVPYNDVFDYGFMWWVATSGPFQDLGMYSAVGRYGQSIDIIPELNLVFVHRVDSNRRTFQFIPRSVSQPDRLRLLQLVIDAKMAPEVNPRNL
ncbi:serine hydrolase domain-containing protein [Evansella sp. AB-rgal1]|uniref:serine hydrolase domain-containing protein n=1 Tax=Evansella sp. AB-rgal1 TaxID=3242696 RepID=UPI00359E8FA7